MPAIGVPIGADKFTRFNVWHMAKILMVLTGADFWTLKDGTKHPTGFWAEEAVVPHQVLKAAGHEVAVAARALNRMLELGRPSYVRIA